MKKHDEIVKIYKPTTFVEYIHTLITKENATLYIGMDLIRSTLPPIPAALVFTTSIIIAYNRESMDSIVNGTIYTGMVTISKEDILNACDACTKDVSRLITDVVGSDMYYRLLSNAQTDDVVAHKFISGKEWPKYQLSLVDNAFIYHVLRDIITKERKVT